MNVEDFLRTHPRRSGDLDVLAACVKACFGCDESCTLCADACLGEEKIDTLRRCIRLDLDCAEICAATGAVVARLTEPDAQVVRAQLQACIAACRACGAECARHARHHEHCRLCAESCRLCAEACEALARTI
jgi:hypothetical protein